MLIFLGLITALGLGAWYGRRAKPSQHFSIERFAPYVKEDGTPISSVEDEERWKQGLLTVPLLTDANRKNFEDYKKQPLLTGPTILNAAL